MQKEKLGITGLYIHCICSTATTPATRQARENFGVTTRVLEQSGQHDTLLKSPDKGKIGCHDVAA